MIAYVNGDGYHFNFIDISMDIDSAENEEMLYAFFVHLHDNIAFATGKCEFLKTSALRVLDDNDAICNHGYYDFIVIESDTVY